MRTFVVGDIHGAHKALLQCLKRSDFDRKHDRLIVLGDVCDVYPGVKECIDELLGLAHCEHVLGNHDAWAIEWSLRGAEPAMWLKQGGDATLRAYGNGPIPKKHFDFLNTSRPWLEWEGRLFAHAGFDPRLPLNLQTMQSLTIDRALVYEAWKEHAAGRKPKVGPYKDIFLGHTPTQVFDSDRPLHLGNIWMMDTGAGWEGKLSIMNVETQEFWQSDSVTELYGSLGNGRSLL